MDLSEFLEIEARRRAHDGEVANAVARQRELVRLRRKSRPLTPAEVDQFLQWDREAERLDREAQDALDRARGLI